MQILLQSKLLRLFKSIYTTIPVVEVVVGLKMSGFVNRVLKLFKTYSLPKLSVERSTDGKQITKPGLPASIWLSSILLNMLGLALPLCILQVYDRILPNNAGETLFFLMLALLGVIVLDTIIKIFRSKLLLWQAASFTQSISSEAFRRIMNAPPSTIEATSLSVHMNRLSAQTSLGDFYAGPGRLLIIDLPAALFYLWIMYLIGGPIIVVPICLLGIFMLVTSRQTKELRDIVLLRSEQNNKKYDFVIEALQGIHTVKSMAMEALMLRRFERLQKQVARLCHRSILMSNAAQNTGALYANLSTIFIVSIGAALVIKGDLSIGVVAACTLLSGQLIQPIIRGLSIWTEFQGVKHNFDESRKIFELEKAPAENLNLPSCNGDLSLKEVTYIDEGFGRPVIEEMSLSCGKGIVTGIHITDATERSSLVQLLCGYEKPNSGHIFIDDLDFALDENRGLKKHIAYVGASPSTFKGTIMENLTMFEQRSDSHAARRASELLGLEQDIHSLPDGYDTMLGEGVYEQLPKPVLQLITLARAISSSPKILVLDNITKTFDRQSFGKFLDGVQKLKKNMTIILISEDESMLKAADVKYQVWGGQLLEENDEIFEGETVSFDKIKTNDSESSNSSVEFQIETDTLPDDEDNPVHDQLKKLELEFGLNEQNGKEEELPAAQLCLDPLLMALGWNGVERHLFEALPHFDKIETIEDLRGVLVRLNYNTAPVQTSINAIKPELMPCLFVSSGIIYVLLGYEEDGSLSAFDSNTQEFIEVPDLLGMKGTAYLLSPIEREVIDNSQNWLGEVMSKFRKLFGMMFGLGFISNLLALALPIYVMTVYDKAISSKSLSVLIGLLTGITLVLFFDIIIRNLRAKAQAYFGARLDELISTQAFSQLMHMHLRMTEAASIGGQITRLRLLESVREAFTGPLANAIIDIPFIVIFITAIIIIGGPIAWIPFMLAGVYLVMLIITVPMMRKHSSQAGDSKAKLQNLVIEAISEHRSIRGTSSESVWIERYQNYAALYAYKNIKTKSLNHVTQTLSQSFLQVTGIATLGIGALMVMNGTLTAGALIAVMALSWRVLNPLHQSFVSLTQLGDTLQSLEQVNKLMRLPLERVPNKLPSVYRSFKGKVDASRLIFSYPGANEPVLRGLTFSIDPGELVAITGNTGSGKSTVLKVLLGLYPLQGGSVSIDGIDIRQLDPGEWRHAISYVPNTLNLFYGSVAQNMRLANPTATEVDITQVAEELGLLDGEYAEYLPEGVHTRLTSKLLAELPDDLKQRILLARSFVKPAPIHMYSAPSQKLNAEGKALLIKKLNELRGKSTVIMVTQERSLVQQVDKAIYMKDGQVIYQGDPETMIKKLSRAA